MGLDKQTGSHRANGALINKLGSVFTSSATGAGNETTILVNRLAD